MQSGIHTRGLLCGVLRRWCDTRGCCPSWAVVLLAGRKPGADAATRCGSGADGRPRHVRLGCQRLACAAQARHVGPRANEEQRKKELLASAEEGAAGEWICCLGKKEEEDLKKRFGCCSVCEGRGHWYLCYLCVLR